MQKRKGMEYMEFRDIVMQRYATKEFDNKIIPEEKIDELLEIIRFTPSALNLQPWKIKVINDRKLKEKLRPATFNQGQVTSCSHLLVFCANTKAEELMEKVSRLMKEAGLPDEMRSTRIEKAKGMFGNMSSDQMIEWAKCHAFLALGNAVNGAKSLGFDSCPMAGFDPAEYSRILELPEHLIPTVLCPLGYAADKPMPKTRLAKEEIFF
jgi:nitroreductase/dihydropteridine reductase